MSKISMRVNDKFMEHLQKVKELTGATTDSEAIRAAVVSLSKAGKYATEDGCIPIRKDENTTVELSVVVI